MTWLVFRTHISLTLGDRALLEAESARTELSIAALVRDAISRAYGAAPDVGRDIQAILSATGAWEGRARNGEAYVEELRSARRFQPADLGGCVNCVFLTASVNRTDLDVFSPEERLELLARLSSKYGDGFNCDDVYLSKLREGWPD